MILAILQVRVSSSRLPGKVLKPILEKPMLLRQIERIQRSRLIDQLLVATSSDHSDEVIANMCCKNHIPCFRGQLTDVLDRFYQGARTLKPNHIVRLTGDCPLADPKIIDEVIDFHLQCNFDYTSNALQPTFPDGLDVEVFTYSCLEQAWREAKLPSQREHVTLFMYNQPQRYKIGNFKNNIDLSSLRWTVDEQLDFELVSQIYQALYPVNPEFTTKDILNLLAENKHLQTLNNKYKRNEGLEKSLIKDRVFIQKEKIKTNGS